MHRILANTSVGILTCLAGSAQAQTANETSGTNTTTFLIFAFVIGGVWLGLKFFRDLGRRTKQEQAVNSATDALMLIAKDFPFYFVSPNAAKLSIGVLCMDREGQRLRFVDFDYSDGKKNADLIVPISNVVSVELSGGNEVITDYSTTSSKPDALAGAVIGGLPFGNTGAIVGATAAGSRGNSLATQRVVEKPSILVFCLSDLNNPVVRFVSSDHEQCDLWLHRVRSAIASHTRAIASAGVEARR